MKIRTKELEKKSCLNCYNILNVQQGVGLLWFVVLFAYQTKATVCLEDQPNFSESSSVCCSDDNSFSLGSPRIICLDDDSLSATHTRVKMWYSLV